VYNLEDDQRVMDYAGRLQPGGAIQARFARPDSEIPFVGVVVENCLSEQCVMIELPNG
jgi:hypothetical protein